MVLEPGTNSFTSSPGTMVDTEIPASEGRPSGKRRFLLGTDSGQDVLSQMLHAWNGSIGLVSTGISVFIGIVIGSLMGYFGLVDLVLSRVVEIFMAILLFLLIVAAVFPEHVHDDGTSAA